MPPSVATTPLRRFLLAVLAALLVGTLINTAWEWRLPPQNSGLRTHPDDRMSTLVHIEMPSLWRDRGLVATVHDVAAGAVLTVPRSGAVDELFMENLAQVDVAVEEYEVELAEDPVVTYPEEWRISGDGVVVPWTEPVQWTVVWDPDSGPATRLRMFTWKSLPVFIDERLVAGTGT